MDPRPAGARLGGLDALKGAAILGVVAIHAAPASPLAYHNAVVSGVARLAVPSFLIVTGFLAGWKQTPPARMRDYFWRFLRLHLIYGLFYWAVQILRTGSAGPLTPKAVLLHFGEAAWAGQFYFVILIQVFFLGAFVLPAGYWRSRTALVLCAVAILAGLAGVQATQAFPDQGSFWAAARQVVGRRNGFWLWLWYFVLGAWLADRLRSGRLPRALVDRRTGVALLLLGAGVAALFQPGMPGWGTPVFDPYARLSILLGASCVGLALPSLASWEAPAPLQRLGELSFGIFVLNPALLMPLLAAFGPVPSPLVSWLYVAIVVAVGVPLTMGLRRFAPGLVP